MKLNNSHGWNDTSDTKIVASVFLLSAFAYIGLFKGSIAIVKSSSTQRARWSVLYFGMQICTLKIGGEKLVKLKFHQRVKTYAISAGETFAPERQPWLWPGSPCGRLEGSCCRRRSADWAQLGTSAGHPRYVTGPRGMIWARDSKDARTHPYQEISPADWPSGGRVKFTARPDLLTLPATWSPCIIYREFSEMHIQNWCPTGEL